MGRESSDKPGVGRFSEKWWDYVATEMEAEWAEKQRTWGGIDEMMIVRYEAGECTEDEKARVEKAMQDFPAVRESIAIDRELTTQDAAPPAADDDAGRRRPDGKPWTGLTGHPKDEPGTTR